MVSSIPSSAVPSPLCKANQGTIGLAFTWILLTIATIVVSLRLYIRLRIRRNIGWDDYTAVVSLMIGIVAGGFFTKMITSGMGRHVSCLSPQSVIAMLEFSAISEALNVIGIGVVKITVCLTLLRVVERGRRQISQFLWCLLLFIAITHLALAMLFFLHCRPLAALWNPNVQGSCLSTHTTVLAGYVGFAIDVVTDLVCAGIPILVIHRLQMNIRTKVALCVLMGLGVFTAGCAVAKAITLKGVFAKDYTWGFTKPATWAAVEQFVGIIIASVPALRSLFSVFLEKSYQTFRIFSNIRRYLIRESKDSGFGSDKSDQGEQQQRSRESKPSMQWIKKHKVLSGSTIEGGSPIDGSPYLSQLTAMEQDFARDSVGEVDIERCLAGKDFYNDEEVPPNFLSEWSLPNIADRRSRILSIPMPAYKI